MTLREWMTNRIRRFDEQAQKAATNESYEEATRFYTRSQEDRSIFHFLNQTSLLDTDLEQEDL